jgi:hypothetical protein
VAKDGDRWRDGRVGVDLAVRRDDQDAVADRRDGDEADQQITDPAQNTPH